MTPNVCFALLDAVVIAGHGDEPVVRTPQRSWSHARLLEEVAALGGVLRHLGVGVGTPCVVAPDSSDQGDLDAVVAALAVARVGGVVTADDDPAAPAVVVSDTSPLTGDGRVRLVRGDAVREPDLNWELLLRAGRTDPAVCELLEPASAYSPDRTVAEEIADLQAARAPYDVADLRRLLRV